MLTIIVIWVMLSLPMSVVLGIFLRDDVRSELVGMDGDVALFRRANGVLERMPLGARASY
jgi:hypothetical protein